MIILILVKALVELTSKRLIISSSMIYHNASGFRALIFFSKLWDGHLFEGGAYIIASILQVIDKCKI